MFSESESAQNPHNGDDDDDSAADEPAASARERGRIQSALRDLHPSGRLGRARRPGPRRADGRRAKLA